MHPENHLKQRHSVKSTTPPNSSSSGGERPNHDASVDDKLSNCLLSRLKTQLTCARAWSFSASLLPVLLGCMIAYVEADIFHPVQALFCVVCVVSVHCAGNFVNSYYDFYSGVDTADSDDASLANKVVTPESISQYAMIAYALGCSAYIGLMLSTDTRHDHLTLLFFLGLSGSFLYTGSIGLKYYALGDVVIILMFGPVSVLFAYTAQVGYFSYRPLIYALPLVMHTEAILHSNNSRDADADAKAGIITLAIIIGKGFSYVVFTLLLFVPYQFMIFLAVGKSRSFLLPFATIPLAMNLEKLFRRRELTKIPQNTAQVSLLFGVFYILAFLGFKL